LSCRKRIGKCCECGETKEVHLIYPGKKGEKGVRICDECEALKYPTKGICPLCSQDGDLPAWHFKEDGEKEKCCKPCKARSSGKIGECVACEQPDRKLVYRSKPTLKRGDADTCRMCFKRGKRATKRTIGGIPPILVQGPRELAEA